MQAYSDFLEKIETHSPAGSLIRLFSEYRKWWLVPTLFCTLAALAVAVLSKNQYSSRQTLVVRDDLVGSAFKPGRFESLESMKSAQETILEIARRPQVIRSALQQLGAPRGKSGDWIDEKVVESTQERINISAPNGAEFGATEAIVLTVEQTTRQRSREFISTLLDEIGHSLRDFRSDRFRSMEQELEEAARVATENYAKSAEHLRSFEANLGPDLGTLISMGSNQSGTSNGLQNELATLLIEQRQAISEVDTVGKQIQILEDVANNPKQILEVPTELLQLLPTLDYLAKGLNEALLKYSTSIGKYSSSHPTVKSDVIAIDSINAQIKQKLSDSIAMLNHQEELRQVKLRRLDDQIAKNRRRLTELSQMRVDYETLRTEVIKRADVKGKANEKLANIQSLASASSEINMFTRVDEPQTDVNPAGPSKKLVLLGGMFAGLFIGIGLVMLVAPTENVTAAVGAFGIPTGNQRPDVSGHSTVEPSSFHSQKPAAQMTTPEPNGVAQARTSNVDDHAQQPQPQQPTAQAPARATTSEPGASTSEFATSASDLVAAIGSSAASSTNRQLERKPKKISDLQVGSTGNKQGHAEQPSPPVANATRKPTRNTSPPVTVAPASADVSIAEKVSQLQHSEIVSSSATALAAQPIITDVGQNPKVSPPANQPGTPLQTSSQNQSVAEFTPKTETPSATTSGQKPDNRPAASTVNLNKLREQLASRKSELGDTLLHLTPQQPSQTVMLPQEGLQSTANVSGTQAGASSKPNPGSATVQPAGTPARELQKQQGQLRRETPTAVPNRLNSIVVPETPPTPEPASPKLQQIPNVQPSSPKTGSGSNSPQKSAQQSSVEVPQVPVEEEPKPESTTVDQHITDLANSIRDMCRPITSMPASPDQTPKV